MTFKRGVKLDPSAVSDKRPNPGAVRRIGPTSAPKKGAAPAKGGGKKSIR